MKRVYPTFIIDTKDNSKYPFLVFVPDMDIATKSDNLYNAIETAREEIGTKGIKDDDENIPCPSNQMDAVKKIMAYTDKADFANGVFTYVDVDFSEYRKRNNSKTVRKSVTIPGWLNCKAEKEGINVSKVLKEALIKELNY